MSEASERRGRSHVDRETVLAAIAPQVDRLIAHKFHLYQRTLEEPSDLEGAEAAFRAAMQDVLIPERIEDLSRLFLVVPTVHTALQAELLGLRDDDYWGTISQDYDLPTQPYVIEIARGSEEQKPQTFTNKTFTGIITSILGPETPGSLFTIQHSLSERRQRGINVFELFAFVRERRDEIRQPIHALRRQSIRRDLEISELSGLYFPRVSPEADGLHCSAASDIYVPSSMAEILYTRKDTKFPGFSPKAS
jgi:hypothetical protein